MDAIINAPSHPSRSSVLSVSDLLADLDETQLHFLLEEMNNTTAQNMAVSQAISAIESDNPSMSLHHARMNMQPPQMTRNLSKSQKLRLSLQTMFRPQRASMNAPRITSPVSSTRSSPSYKRISRPFLNFPPEMTVGDLQALLYAELYEPYSPVSSSSIQSTSPASSMRKIRRYPSTIDMALEAERSAIGHESLALGLLEPRPVTPNLGMRVPSTPVPTSSPAVLDGIFETMENR